MSDDSIEPGIDDQLIGDFLVERTTINLAHLTEPDMTICPSFDDPGSFPPTHHSWLSHDIGWVRFGDGLPAFPQSRQ
jgi:hypothetical protein